MDLTGIFSKVVYTVILFTCGYDLFLMWLNFVSRQLYRNAVFILKLFICKSVHYKMSVFIPCINFDYLSHCIYFTLSMYSVLSQIDV